MKQINNKILSMDISKLCDYHYSKQRDLYLKLIFRTYFPINALLPAIMVSKICR